MYPRGALLYNGEQITVKDFPSVSREFAVGHFLIQLLASYLSISTTPSHRRSHSPPSSSSADV